MTQFCGVFRTDELMREGFRKVATTPEQQYQQIYLDDKGQL